MTETKITTELVKELRDATGISIMQCRKALIEAGADMKKALAILKKGSAEIALKKADRAVKDGRVIVKEKESKAVLVALHCETDFVGRSEDFIKLLEALADKALNEGVENMRSVAKEMIDPVIQKTGENIVLGDAYEVKGKILGSYVHNNKSAVIVSLSAGTPELARDIAMHVAAMKPEYTSENEIDEETRKTMSEIFQKEVTSSDKPEEIKKKMLEGKLATYFKERTLLDQAFIKNPEETVGILLEKNGASVVEIKKYII